MLNLVVNNRNVFKDYVENPMDNNLSIQANNIEEKVFLLIIRDLKRLRWQFDFKQEKIIGIPPIDYDKEVIRIAMSIRRQELIERDKKWIESHVELLRENLADGDDVLTSSIDPQIEICESSEQHNIFRILRYYWSSPFSDYVGRRMRILVRDHSIKNKPVIGIAALGSSIIHIPERDKWVKWDKETRTKNLIYAMDAFVLGALPPYNYLLGGKLLSYMITSNELRELYQSKYKDKVTTISKRKANDLVCLFTTSLYGKSSQYNRVKYKKRYLYKPIGSTKGYGTLHLSEETFQAMLELLKQRDINVTHKFGDGPSWRMRVIRTIGDLLKFDSNGLLQHSFKRSIYAIPLARNFRAFLNGKSKKPLYYDQSLKELIQFWKERWLGNRLKSEKVISDVVKFKSGIFEINQ